MKMLLITTLDVAGRQNNREHHLIEHYAPKAEAFHLIYRRRRPPDAGLGAMLTASRDSVTYQGLPAVAVTPRLSPPDGLVRDTAAGVRGASAAKRALGTVMDGVGSLRDRLTIQALRTAARDVAQPDMLALALGPWAALAVLPLRRAGQLGPVVYVDRDYEPGFTASALRRHGAIRAERMAAGQADLTLCIGNRLMDRLKDVAGAKLALSPTGVDHARFVRLSPSGSHPRRLIHVGEVAPWAGLEEAVGALAELDAVELWAIGPVSDAYRAHLEELARQRGVADRVQIMGKRPREYVIDELGKGGIGFAVFRPHPLRQYAAPLKVLEYMAAGLPVLAAEGSEAGDMVSRTGTGLALACSAQEICTATTRLLNDPAQFCAAAQAGPAVAADHDWTVILAREEQMLRGLLNADEGSG
ncbi:MAG: glycosyltransferase [Paracoccaceae bacterium]